MKRLSEEAVKQFRWLTPILLTFALWMLQNMYMDFKELKLDVTSLKIDMASVKTMVGRDRRH
jgi:hypothetical protein